MPIPLDLVCARDQPRWGEEIRGKGVIMIRRRWFVWAGLFILTITTLTCKEQTAPPPQPPPPPMLASPASGATGVITNPALTWNVSTMPASYYVQVSTDPGFATLVVDQANIVTSSFAACLTWNTVYYWRVLAGNPQGRYVVYRPDFWNRTDAYSPTKFF